MVACFVSFGQTAQSILREGFNGRSFGMTRSPDLDSPQLLLQNHSAVYEDGSKHVFGVPQSTLEQGLPNEGRYSIACIIAYEWQQDGYLKPGKIARVYRLR